MSAAASISASKRSSASLKTNEEEEHQAAESKKKKKCIQRKTANNTNSKLVGLQLDGLLEGDIGDAVFSFLDKSELLRIVRVSKAMKAKLKHEHVIRAGMMHTFSKTTITRIVNSLDKIYVPSPVRILQLINGKSCERCQNSNIRQVFGEFGVYMCVSNSPCYELCLNKMITRIGTYAEPPPYLQNSMACQVITREGVKQVYVWAGDPWTSSTGERCGPLINARDVQSLKHDAQAVQKLLQERQEDDPLRGQVAVIRQVFQENVNLGKRRQEERRLEREAKAAKAVLNKKKKIQDMVNYISSCIPDEKVWKTIALVNKDRDGLFTDPFVKKCPVYFTISKVQEMMRGFIETPKKAKQPLLKDVAENITELFDTVYEKEYHTLSFLSKTNTFERILRTQLLRSKSLDLILNAAVTAVSYPNNNSQRQEDNVISHLIDTWDRDVIAAILASTTVPDGQENFAHRLANTVWKGRECSCDHRNRYNLICNSFPQLLENAFGFVATAAESGVTFVDPAANNFVSVVWDDWKMMDLLSTDNYKFNSVLRRAEDLRTRHQRRMQRWAA